MNEKLALRLDGCGQLCPARARQPPLARQCLPRCRAPRAARAASKAGEAELRPLLTVKG